MWLKNVGNSKWMANHFDQSLTGRSIPADQTVSFDGRVFFEYLAALSRNKTAAKCFTNKKWNLLLFVKQKCSCFSHFYLKSRIQKVSSETWHISLIFSYLASGSDGLLFFMKYIYDYRFNPQRTAVWPEAFPNDRYILLVLFYTYF